MVAPVPVVMAKEPADPELRGPPSQGTAYPFVAHGLGSSGLGNAGFIDRNKTVIKFTDQGECLHI